MSRTPVREAIRRLQSEGLIDAKPQKGATVKKLSMEEVYEIYTIRARLEGLAVELAVSNINKEAEKKLLGFKKKFRLFFEKKEILRWLDENINFHLYFAVLSKNVTLFEIIKNLSIRVHKYKHIALMKPEFIELYTSQHEEVIHNAVVTKKPKKAGTNMYGHLEAVKKNLVNYLKDFPFY